MDDINDPNLESKTTSEMQSSGASPIDMSPDEIARILAAPAPTEITGQKTTPANAILDDKEVDSLLAEHAKEEKFGDRPLEAGGLAALSSLTFSASDRLLEKTGLVDKETLRELSERNPEADIVGQIGGAIAPAFLTGGASVPASAAGVGARAAIKATAPALAAKAALAAERQVAKAIGSAAAETGSKKLVSEILKKTVAKGTGSAVEGSLFGANQLLREDAIGKTELNAENLLSYMSEGAAVGGALGAALVPGGIILKSAGSGLSRGISKAKSKLLDPVENAKQFLFPGAGEAAKIERASPTFFENLPTWINEKVNLKENFSNNKILAKLTANQKAATEALDATVAQLDDVAKSRGQAIGPGIYDDLAGQLEKEYILPNVNKSHVQSDLTKTKQVIEDFRTAAAKHRANGTTPSVKELRDWRIDMDALAKFNSTSTAQALQTGRTARTILKDVMLKYADAIDNKLGAQLKEAHKDYHYSTVLEKQIKKKLAKSNSKIDLGTILLGDLGTDVGGAVVGLPLAVANRLINSDLRRKVAILSQLEKSTQNVAAKTKSSISNFLKSTTRASKTALTGALTRSALADRPGKEKPKNKLAAFENVQDNIIELATDPLKMQDRIAMSTAVLAQGAPQTAANMGETMQRAVDFLARKLPKDARDGSYSIFEPKYQPSSIELSTFDRYLQVVDNPLSVLANLESGSLTRDHVEALKAVYPNLFNEIRVEVLNAAQDGDLKLNYNKRVQLGILLDIPADASLSPNFILQMQANFVPPEQRGDQTMGAVQSGSSAQASVVPPTQTGASRINSAERQLTNEQRVASGKTS